MRRVLRLVGWNALWLVLGLASVGLVAEVWLRSSTPFVGVRYQHAFVPNVGLLLRPNTEVRWTNGFDFWTISHTNSLGFLDRAPPNPEHARESCHIAIVGDSFVEAKEVPIADKLQVQLEELAARQLPHLDVTTSAFGKSATGQINQLPFYDEYVRRLRPKMLALVFVPNDYANNLPLWRTLRKGWHPDHLLWVSAARTEDGGFRLRPPDPHYQQFRLPWHPTFSERATVAGAYLEKAVSYSLLLDRLRRKYDLHFSQRKNRLREAHWREWLRRNPAYAPLLEGLEELGGLASLGGRKPKCTQLLVEGRSPPICNEAFAFTAFGLDEFRKRAERDGVALVILASHVMAQNDGALVLKKLAGERGIPVIDQSDVIRRAGAAGADAQWAHDYHWNPAGHRWAAQALLEYLERNQWICDKGRSGAEAA